MSTRLQRWYPEVQAGGFTRRDGTVEFYQRLRALVGPESVVLNVGAGRGQAQADTSPARRKLQMLRGLVSEVVGLDVDPAVEANPWLDKSVVVTEKSTWPFEPLAFDAVVADWTLEHVALPELFASEIRRVLKPGGWFMARTPNKFGYIAAASRLIPNSAHVSALATMQPDKAPEDTFPTRYRLNCRRALTKAFPVAEYDHFTYTYDSEPTYGVHSRAIFLATQLAIHVAPPGLRSTLLIFIQKR